MVTKKVRLTRKDKISTGSFHQLHIFVCVYDMWLWGHYHTDRAERPHCEIYYKRIEDLNTIWNRWFDKNNSSINYIDKSPKYILKDNPWANEI